MLLGAIGPVGLHMTSRGPRTRFFPAYSAVSSREDESAQQLLLDLFLDESQRPELSWTDGFSTVPATTLFLNQSRSVSWISNFTDVSWACHFSTPLPKPHLINTKQQTLVFGDKVKKDIKSQACTRDKATDETMSMLLSGILLLVWFLGSYCIILKPKKYLLQSLDVQEHGVAAQ